MELIFGRHPLTEALKAKKRTIRKLWVLTGLEGEGVHDILHEAKQRGIPIEWTSRDHLTRLCRGNHQGFVAQAETTHYQDFESFLKNLESKRALLVAFDEIQDPQNVGAILRSAGFFGVDAAIMPKWRNAPIAEGAQRASSGAMEHINLIQVVNIVQTIDTAKEAGFEVIGAEMEGQAIWKYERPDRVLLVLGSEGKGLRRLVREHCDQLISIPRQGPLDSLNVSAAAAILLYELVRPSS